jgi:hypothetical protein
VYYSTWLDPRLIERVKTVVAMRMLSRIWALGVALQPSKKHSCTKIFATALGAIRKSQ